MVFSYQCDEHQARQRWPTTYLRGLVDLQLSGLSSSMSPSIQELSTILSGSPTLVTLRLRGMAILPGQALAVALPKLQLLDLYTLDHTSLLVLLSALSPGIFELEFRFSLCRLTNRDVTEVVLPFCRRSNIVSLHLSDMNKGPDVRVGSILQCLPFMRVLFLDNEHDDFYAGNTMNTNSGKNTAWCPGLHTLCLIINNDRLKEDAQEQVEKILEVYFLHTIVLVGFDPKRNANFFDSLTSQVQSVIVNNEMFDGEYEDWDLRFRKLVEASKFT
ncbi:hypothetical protein FRC09_020121 [Ceratobasidium sp. 395]|nr:hypothetical protein FRC09_020121 [Ceratobasidium sp. 395]